VGSIYSFASMCARHVRANPPQAPREIGRRPDANPNDARTAKPTRRGAPGKRPEETTMAQGDTQITIAGNFADDPELRFTPAGQPVARFRVASVPRYFDKTAND
jgi:hypothetical protein